MAQRAKRKSKDDPSYRTLKAEYYPVQRQIGLGTQSNSTRIICDVGRVLSQTNHRLYRQGKTYQVKVEIDNRADETGPAQFDVFALTDTWMVQKAWQMARATYLKATADEREKMSSQKIARWEDFRVTAGIGPGALFAFPYQYSETLGGALVPGGEFETSEITLADGTTQRTFTWGSTPSASEYSMIQEYDKAGATNAAPQVIDAANAYADADDRTDDAQMDDLANKGNLPPYDENAFSNNVWVKIATLDNSAVANPSVPGGHSRMSTGFFNAPCGLVVIVPSIASTLNGNVSLTVKAGQYKGVAAMNMGA